MFPTMIHLAQLYGQDLVNHVHYLTRTFAFYMHREKLITTNRWPGHQFSNLDSSAQNNQTFVSGPPPSVLAGQSAVLVPTIAARDLHNDCTVFSSTNLSFDNYQTVDSISFD